MNDLWIAPRGLLAGPGVQAADGALPDWSGLHARLSAAHALRRELAAGDSGSAQQCGSFFDWQVPACDGATGKRGVNLKDSTDRKGPWGIAFGIAGPVHAGDREQ